MKSSAIITSAAMFVFPAHSVAQTAPTPTLPQAKVCTTTYAALDAARQSVRALPSLDGKLHVWIDGKELVLTLEDAASHTAKFAVLSREPDLAPEVCAKNAALLQEYKNAASGFIYALPRPASNAETLLAEKRGYQVPTPQSNALEIRRGNLVLNEIVKARPPIVPNITQCETTMAAINATKQSVKFQSATLDTLSFQIEGKPVAFTLAQAMDVARTSVSALGQPKLDADTCARSYEMVRGIRDGLNGLDNAVRVANLQGLQQKSREKGSEIAEARKDCLDLPKDYWERWKKVNECSKAGAEAMARSAEAPLRATIPVLETVMKSQRMKNILDNVRSPRIIATP